MEAAGLQPLIVTLMASVVIALRFEGCYCSKAEDTAAVLDWADLGFVLYISLFLGSTSKDPCSFPSGGST